MSKLYQVGGVTVNNRQQQLQHLTILHRTPILLRSIWVGNYGSDFNIIMAYLNSIETCLLEAFQQFKTS
jgi:hypothetical protein